jgi:hypothetical protein
MVADELRRQADLFIDLTDLMQFIERATPPAEGDATVRLKTGS